MKRTITRVPMYRDLGMNDAAAGNRARGVPVEMGDLIAI